jgi:hypothetical protein
MEYTRPATWEDGKLIARHFAEAGVDYALVGGYALAAHGFSRFTDDIDGGSIRLLDVEGLLKTKQGLRPKDQMDAAVLSAALGKIIK